MPTSPRCCAAGAPGRPYATFGLALAALAEPHWSALTPVRPLRLWRLIEVKDEQRWPASRLRIDERVLHYLAGVNYLDTRLRPLLRAACVAGGDGRGHARVVEAAVQALEARRRDAGGAARWATTPPANETWPARSPPPRPAAASAARGGHSHQRCTSSMRSRCSGSARPRCSAARCSSNAKTARTARRGSRSARAAWSSSARASPCAVNRPTLHFAVDKPSAAEQKRLWAQALGAAPRA